MRTRFSHGDGVRSGGDAEEGEEPDGECSGVEYREDSGVRADADNDEYDGEAGEESGGVDGSD